MTSSEFWAAIVVTDRPDSFALLCEDIHRQSAAAGVRAAFLVVENSRGETHRRRDAETLAGLVAEGCRVSIDAMSHGDPLHRSRERLRRLLARRLSYWPRPRFVWQLDDDVRLLDLIWRDDHVSADASNSHLRFLFEVADTEPDIKVLVGQVSGDPPIPPIATYASRLNDLAENLRHMLALDPGAPWKARASDLEALREHDAYYDFSVDRHEPCWTRAQRWLPRAAGATVESATADMLSEAVHIPAGVAFSRPILAQRERWRDFAPGMRRGANAVFFDATLCSAHPYPVAELGGMATRRSDMIGTRLVAHRYPGSVLASGFSMLHLRTRGSTWPRREQLTESLLTDFHGAVLAREVDARLAPVPQSERRPERIGRVRAAVATLPGTLSRLEELARGHGFRGDPDIVLDLVGWARREVPGAVDGRLPAELDSRLSCARTMDDLRALATALTSCAESTVA